MEQESIFLTGKEKNPVAKDALLPYPNNRMLASYLLATQQYRQNHKSEHWDVFSNEFEEIIKTPSLWPTFRRNGISAGYDDSTTQFISAKSQNKIGQFAEPLLIQNEAKISHRNNIYEHLKNEFGKEFLQNALQFQAGSPSHHIHDGLQLNISDLTTAVFAFQIQQLIPKTQPFVFAEIGAGFGGLSAMLKCFYPNSVFVIFDLPEVNATQTWFLTQSYPNAKVLTFSEIPDSFSEPGKLGADFIILPGWAIEQLKEKSVDIFINIRSFMEMNRTTIDYYFKHIQRIINPEGCFYCVNRYLKQSAGEDIQIKNYPFDSNWQTIFSKPSLLQNHIHELFLQRTGKTAGNIKAVLAELRDQ